MLIIYLEIELNLHKSHYVIFPYSTSKFGWDILQIALILLISIIVPFNLSFGVQTGFIEIFVIIEILVFLDLVINANCGFFEKGMLIMQRKLIIIRYLKSWFLIDFLSSLPAYSLFYIFMGKHIYLPADELLTLYSEDKTLRSLSKPHYGKLTLGLFLLF